MPNPILDRRVLLTRRAAPAAFSPSDISGLVLWLKADSLSLNDGDAVATWADSSGEGNDATQASAAQRPTYKTNIVNGKPVVRFIRVGGDTSQSDFLRTANFGLVQPYTLFLVVKVLTADASARLVDGLSGDTSEIRITAGDVTKVEIYAGNFLTQTLPTPTAAFAVLAVVFNGATSAVYANGVLHASGNVGTQTPNGLTLAAYDILGNASCHMDTPEWLVYEGAHDATTVDEVTTYLMDKYGL